MFSRTQLTRPVLRYDHHQPPAVQVFDRDKRYKRSIYIGAPVTAVCYLNDEGDILVAMGLRLVVLRASQYDKAPTSKKVGAARTGAVRQDPHATSSTSPVRKCLLAARLSRLCAKISTRRPVPPRRQCAESSALRHTR